MKGRHFLRIADWTRDELEQVLELAGDLKRRLKAGEEHRLLPGRQLGMVFDKPSTRTRISFEVGMTQLGGHVALSLPAGMSFSGSFELAITLPQGVSEDGVKADFRNGVLEVHVAKPEQPKPKKIPIGSPEQATIEA